MKNGRSPTLTAHAALGASAGVPSLTPVAQGTCPDVFKIPEGSLPRRIWQCESSWGGNHYEARGWRSRKGFSYVANVIDGITYLATSMDESIEGPPRPDCVEIDPQELTASQYADLVATLLQVEEDETKGRRWNQEPTLTVLHQGFSFKLQPRFSYRGLVAEPVDGAPGEPEPHMTVTVKHEVVPPPGVQPGGIAGHEGSRQRPGGRQGDARPHREWRDRREVGGLRSGHFRA